MEWPRPDLVSSDVRQDPRAARAGFTLLELFAVVAVIAALVTLAVPRIRDAQERAKVARAIGDIRAISADLDGQDTLPETLAQIGRANLVDPWGAGYVYLKFPDDSKSKGPPAGARRDRFLVPINSTYDLYSMGKDGATTVALTARNSQDDVIRANDGGFIGLASRF